ncbi:hypothetical protein [Methylopila sp. M107]|uniref:hypothetical protein n=1 Tax=Methylopila sp. M107 TaxID=1101190 RepID=UPI00035CEF79|nr:hypothetical protein [Methylopila sp. M107]
MTLAAASLAVSGSLSPALLDFAAANEVAKEFAACRALGDDVRLACYDRLAAKVVPPRFSGRLTVETEQFEIDRPTVLRFQSDGPIFVMYLRDAQNHVVQNLHIGGGGEDVYLIDKPGTYSLHINGAETWRVWLEPKS